MSNSEKINFNPEQKNDPEALDKVARERYKELRENLEKEPTVEDNKEKLENARHEAIEKATSAEKEKSTEQNRETSPAERRKKSPIDGDAGFTATMTEIQEHMSPASKTFSKVIHNKTVEKVSDVTASTIARPNAILTGAVFAFVLTLGIYLLAKNFGYPLSGFETIGAFILGWVLGIIYDFLKVMITGRK